MELHLDTHFEALRHFLLMEDGEFAQSLSDLLFEKVTLRYAAGIRLARKGSVGRMWALGPPIHVTQCSLGRTRVAGQVGRVGVQTWYSLKRFLLTS